MSHILDSIVREFWENIYPTTSESNGKVIIISTPNGYNLFSELYLGAKEGKNDFHATEVNWYQIPGRDKEWYDKEVAILGEEGFNRQYGIDFSSGSGILLSPITLAEIRKKEQKYISHELDPLETIDELDYKKYLKFRDSFSLDDCKDKSKYYLFSIDLAEGGGEDSDFTIFNMFSVEPINSEYFPRIQDATSYQSFFGLKQIALWRSNDISLQDCAKVLYKIVHEIFNSENVKLIIEINTYGNEFIKYLQTVFPGKNDFDTELILKFKHKSDDRISKQGLKMKQDNKDILAHVFKKFIREGKLELTNGITIDELWKFGKNNKGHYGGSNGHDDVVMSSLIACEYFNTIEFADAVEERYEHIDENVKKEIDKALDREQDSDGSLQFDIYEILNQKPKYNY